MQRLPVNRIKNMQSASEKSQSENSPVLLMAKKIRREQGVEQLRSFLSAVEPFIPPNELKSICNVFGMNYNALTDDASHQTAFRPGNFSAGNDKIPAGNFPGGGRGNRNRMNGIEYSDTVMNPGNRGNRYSKAEAAENPNRSGNMPRNRNINTKSKSGTGSTRSSFSSFNGNKNMNTASNSKRAERGKDNAAAYNSGMGSDIRYGMNPNGNMNNGANISFGMGMNQNTGINQDAGMNQGNGMNGNPLQMMQTFMQMQNIMKNGADMQKILNFFASR